MLSRIPAPLQDLVEQPKAMGPDALLKTVAKKQRHRTGYEDGQTTMHAPLSALAFVAAKDPVPMLAQYTVIHLDGPESTRRLKRPGAADEDSDAEEVRRERGAQGWAGEAQGVECCELCRA